MNRCSLAEGHFCRDFAIAIPDTLAMLFEEFSKLRLRHTEMRSLERLPNLFAASENSGIIPPGFYDERDFAGVSFSHVFAGLRCFTRPTVEAHREWQRKSVRLCDFTCQLRP